MPIPLTRETATLPSETRRARSRKRLAAAEDRAQRDQRIFSRMQKGWSYEAIAEAEGLSRERIRQIIRESLEGRDAEPSSDHVRLQMARLDPALRLTAAKVAAGDIKAVDRLIRVLNQMDKYQGKAAPALDFENEDDARERILPKLSMVDQRRAAYAEDDLTGLGGGEEAARDETVSKFFPRQVVDIARNGKA